MFSFEVKEVKRLAPHENDQALWDKVLGKDVVSSEKDFREKVSEELACNSTVMLNLFSVVVLLWID